MNNKNLTGQVVTLRSSTGDISRVVVQDLGEVLLVCKQDEYDMAMRDAREPAAIGFRRTDMIEK